MQVFDLCLTWLLSGYGLCATPAPLQGKPQPGFPPSGEWHRGPHLVVNPTEEGPQTSLLIQESSRQDPADSPFKPEPSTDGGFGSGGFGSGGFGADEPESESKGRGDGESTGEASGEFGSGGFGTGGFDLDAMKSAGGNSAGGSNFGSEEIPEVAAHSIPRLEYSLGKAKQSDYVGGDGGAQFIDKAPAGALMVGMQVSISTDIFENIQGIRPIYQRGTQLLPGEWHGVARGDVTTIMARPGFAVGGLLLRHGVSLESIQIAFVAVREDGRLNAKDFYLSDSVGDTQFGREITLNTEGRHVVGMFGRADNKVFGLGLAALRATKSANQDPVLETSGEGAGNPGGKEPYRTWTSSNGKFSVKAQLQQIEDGKVILLREDGKTAVVEIAKLSEADQSYLRGKPGSR